MSQCCATSLKGNAQRGGADAPDESVVWIVAPGAHCGRYCRLVAPRPWLKDSIDLRKGKERWKESCGGLCLLSAAVMPDCGSIYYMCIVAFTRRQDSSGAFMRLMRVYPSLFVLSCFWPLILSLSLPPHPPMQSLVSPPIYLLLRCPYRIIICRDLINSLPPRQMSQKPTSHHVASNAPPSASHPLYS